MDLSSEELVATIGISFFFTTLFFLSGVGVVEALAGHGVGFSLFSIY
jgi:hypothetical protein